MKSFANLFFVFVLMFFSNNFVFSASSSDSLQVNQGVDGCNNNSICEPVTGETILSCPNDCSVITPPPDGGGGGGIINQLVYNVKTETGLDSAIIRFQTRIPTFTTVRWGETIEYKIGSIRSTIFVTDHVVNLTGLVPGTRYFFSIEYQDRTNHTAIGYSGTFITNSLPEQHLVPNPTNVSSSISKNAITIRWKNPVDEYLDYIRVMRNEDRFHSTTSVGKLIYEGVTEHFVDSDVEVGRKYYYTLFSRDISGEFSSGVGVVVMFNPSDDTSIIFPPTPIKEKDLLPHFIVVQEGRLVQSADKTGEITDNKTFQIESMPKTFQGFQDLWAEIRDPDKTWTRAYLFIYDKEREVYQTNISPLSQKGDYEVRIYGFNKDHTVLLSEGVLIVKPSTQIKAPIKELNNNIVITLLGLIILLACIIWLKKRTEI